MDKKDTKLQRILEPGFRFYFVVLFAFAAACLVVSLSVPDYRGYSVFALIQGALYVVLFVLYYIANKRKKREILKYIDSATSDAESFSSGSVFSYPLPMIVVRLDSGDIIWSNDDFDRISEIASHLFEKRISDVIPDFDLRWLMDGKPTCPYDVHINGKVYTVYGNIVRSDSGSIRGLMAYLTWLDITEIRVMQKELSDKNVVVADIVWDNYDDVMKNISDVNRSLMTASLDEKLHFWVQPTNGVLRRTERNRYLFFFEEKWLAHFAGEKFSIIDAVREIKSDNGISVTLSIGIGKGGKSLAENENYSHLAIDMALSRGGSQVVIRNNLSFDFFGGRSAEYEKRSKVKSRVMANVLEGLIKDSDNIIVMGHKYADIDALGAAAGIVCAARRFGKKAYIVIDQERNLAKSLLEHLKTNEAYGDVFISGETAMINGSSGSLLVVVDTNRPVIVEYPPLLESFNKIAVIDHHRRASDYIENAAINIHEPSASSACEIVAELLQYMLETGDFAKVESDALLAGIFLDTKNFTLKTGARTFEAAAYLRLCGADMLEIKQIFQNDFQSFVTRSELIKNTEFYRDIFAIIVSDIPIDQVTASQAADELLNITGVQASFVIYPTVDYIYVSARSLGRINVQLIIEKLGGGGNFSTAAAQIKNSTSGTARIDLTAAINAYITEA